MRPSTTRAPRVLFRIAAGPRIGFGHLRRCTVLAGALGTRATVSMRGGDAARAAARRLGCRLVDAAASRAMATIRPELLIVDDPRDHAARRWARAARRAGVPVASIRDMGYGLSLADLVVDGSVAAVRASDLRTRLTLAGPRYAVINPLVGRLRRRRHPRTIVIALGGGHHISAAIDLAHRIIRRDSRALVRIVTGVAGSRRSGSSRIRMLPLLPHLGGELARCTVAVVGGGVTAYEACCLATPAVAVAVAPAQRRAIRAFAARGALIDGGSLGPNFSRAAATVASQVDTLMSAPGRRRAVGRAAARIVDGRGALRVARALRRLAAAGIPS